MFHYRDCVQARTQDKNVNFERSSPTRRGGARARARAANIYSDFRALYLNNERDQLLGNSFKPRLYAPSLSQLRYERVKAVYLKSH